MKLSKWRSVVTVVLMAGLMAACQATEQVRYSGFLKSYSQLKPDPKFDGTLRWQDPKVNLATYNKFIVDPVLIHFAPQADGIGLDPVELAELTAFARKTFIDELSKNFQVVASPGPGTLRLRAAITGIKETTPVLNIHPAMKLSGMGLGGASGEGEVVDSLTGIRIIAAVDSRMGDRVDLKAGLSKLGHAKQVVEFWADRFVRVMREAHGMKS
jgi:hypothetical protein